jgi:PadR family transcriptional regulator PadR
MRRVDAEGQHHDTQLLKGVLTLVVLTLLGERESYGYQLVTEIRGLGLESLPDGTIYPALNRLEREGLIASRLVPSELGPARKYYRTTPAGHEVLATGAAAWRRLVAAVDPLLGTARRAEGAAAHRSAARSSTKGVNVNE